MRRTLPGAVAAALACLSAGLGCACAETLGELVAREDGVALGRCDLDPPPGLPGDAVHAVVPARFDTPGIWSTRSLLLVGVDAGGVRGQRELRLAKAVPPREVIGVVCRGDRVTIRTNAGTWHYRWTGDVLTARRAAPERR